MATFRKFLGFTVVEVMVVVLVVGVLLSMAVPNLIRARTSSRLQSAIANLKRIDVAKQQFAMDHKLLTGNVVNDEHDLVPDYLPQWPTGPIPGADYTAQAVGTEPTMNSISAASLQAECGGPTVSSACPF